MHTHTHTHTHTHEHARMHLHTQATTNIYCTHHCACPRTKNGKKGLWMMWECRQAVYPLRSMCHLRRAIYAPLYMCVCMRLYLVEPSHLHMHHPASVQKSKLCLLESQFFCLSATIATFSAVKLWLFAITVHTQVFIIVAVLNVSPGSSCHEHQAPVPLSNLQQQQQQQQKAAHFNGKPFNSFMQSTCRGYYCWCV